MDRVAEPWHGPLGLPLAGHEPACQRREVRLGGISGQGLLQHARGLLRGAAEPIAHAQQPGGDRSLQRLRRTEVRQPRRDRARRHAVFDQRDCDGVEHDRFLRGGQPSLQLEERKVTERDVADQVDELMPANDDPVGGGPPKVGAQLLAFAHAVLTRRVLYAASPKSASATRSTLQRNVSADRTAASISAMRPASEA